MTSLLTRCQKSALLQTAGESVIWMFGMATFVGAFYLLAWGITTLWNTFTRMFPDIALILHWAAGIGILIAALIFFILLICAPIKHRYDELKKRCERRERG